ncbi:MAG: GAF domain-containing protein [Balneolaceae bacterium]|nr:GAF domain-containing protein [Balneolaceae bacterium]
MTGSKNLSKKLEQREAEIAVINSVQQGILAKKEMQEIYDLVGEKVRDLFDAQVAVVSTFNYENNTEIFHYAFEDGKRHELDPRPIDTLRQKLIETSELILINENADDAWREITGEEPTVAPGTKLTKSALYVPMAAGDTVFGYISLQNVDREHAFSDSDVRLLSTMANSISMALENARLFNETEQRNAELAVINSVQEGLVAEMDLQSIYDLVGDRIRELFDAQVTMICTFDHDNEREHFQYQYEDGDRIYPDPRPLDRFRKQLIETKEMILINENFPDRAEEILGIKPEAVPGTDLPKSVLFVPLVIGDSVRGYVSLQNLDREHAFPESDVRLLSTLANSMSVALENARLFNETEQRNAELAVINSVQQGLVAEMDMQGIYDLVGDRIRNLFDAQVTGIVTFDHTDKTEHFQYIYEDGKRVHPPGRPYDNVRAKLIQERQKLLFNEKASETMSEINGKPFKPVPGTRMAQSALYVPMSVGKEVLGYVSLQNLDREHAFNESDVRLLSTLINSMSVAIENARLFNETTRLLAETEQRNAELAVINSVQDGLVREMDMAAIYKLVGEKICDVLNTQTMIIRTFDHDKKLEYWQYAIERGETIDVEPRPFIWANKILIEKKEYLLINENYEEIAMEYDGNAITKGLAPKSAIFVPMIVGDTVVGSVSLQNVEEENAFTESDLQLITTLTNSMSVAIENARLFNETVRLLDETEQRAAELQTVNNISRAMVSQLELDALISFVGDQMRETFKADIVYLATYDRKSNMLHFPYYYGDESESRPFGNGITEKIILNQEPLLINQNLDKAYDEIKAEKKGEMVESYLGVPIKAGEKSIGVISVQSKEQSNRFSENDQRLLTTIAANVGVAMQNAESYEKLRSALNDLKAAQEQLVQQEKLASLGQLTAGIAHEIKNPLNFVNNFSDLSVELIEEAREELEKLTIPDDNFALDIIKDIEGNLKKIHEHGSRADGIVKSMLQHSRGGNGKVEPTDMNALIKEYVNLAFHGMRASKHPINVDIDLNLDENTQEIPLIAEDFSRVILNLCNNAFDAMREKLQKAEYNDDKYLPQLKVVTEHNDKYLKITIEDNGPGIPPKLKDKILQPFFTTKKGKEGTGLGLSITNDIVKGHGGQIDIETEPDRFTRFLITIPYQKNHS